MSNTATQQPHQVDAALAHVLVSQEGMTADNVANLTEQAHTMGMGLDRYLVVQGSHPLERIGELLASHHHMPYVALTSLELPNPDVANLLPDEFLHIKQILPIALENGRLKAVTLQPDAPGLSDEITYLSGLRPELCITTPMEWDDYHQAQRENSVMGISLMDTHSQEQTYLQLTNDIINQAIQLGASDIHIEPRKENTAVRCRLDGVLVTTQELPTETLGGILARLKVLAGMDIAEHRKAQDGQFTHEWQDATLFMRVSTFPMTQNREKVTLRILRPFQSVMSFESLGMSSGDVRTVQALLTQPHGIVLVCGPTGSGKSTTVYAMLAKISQEPKNITTIEDPVELELDGINQSQIQHRNGMTYPNSIKALLRQDPDVVMVGEIRDMDALGTTLQAALTGHLMMSTFHSNNAAGAITRMLDMGISPKLLSSGLAGIIAQRLVRVLCPHCKQCRPIQPYESDILFPNQAALAQGLQLYHPQGCKLCHNTGYKGRIGVFELMPMDRELRYLIAQSADEQQLEDAAISGGMISLSLNGREKVIQGITSIEEVARVFGITLPNSGATLAHAASTEYGTP